MPNTKLEMKTTQPKATLTAHVSANYEAQYGEDSAFFATRHEAEEWLRSKHVEWLKSRLPLTDDQIRNAIKRDLPKVKGFLVDNAIERQKALDIARGLGRRIATRRRKDSAGFLVFAIE